MGATASSTGDVNSLVSRQQRNLSPSLTKTTPANPSLHIKRDTMTINVDEYLSKGRPLWVKQLHIGAPAPNNYQYKTPIESQTEKTELKPNKCLFGEPYDKYKRACDIDHLVKVFDHSKHYASSTVEFKVKNPDLISPLDTSMARKKNNPVYSIPKSSEILFKQEIKKGRETPGPSDYNQDDQATKDTKNFQVSIPHDTRPMDKIINLSPGPGAYETENLTNMAKKIESKNSIHQTYSETMS